MQYFGFDRPSFGIKTFGFGANFDPLTLFKDGKQGVWYDPSDKSTLFQDVAGTVPVTKDGDPVALMKDKSGNNNHATQSVSAARPMYKTDGILHWLQVDGIDDCFDLPNLPMPNPDNMQVHAVLSTAENKSVAVWSSQQTDSIGYPDYAWINSSGNFAPVTRSNGIDYISVNTSIVVKNKASIVTSAILGNVFSARVNLGIYTSTTITANTNVLWRDSKLFCGPRGEFFFAGKYYGSVILLSPLEPQNKVALYLAAKAGVTL